MKKRAIKLLFTIPIFIFAFVYYLNNTYKLSYDHIDYLKYDQSSSDKYLYFKGESKKALIIYPDDKITKECYSVLAYELATQLDLNVYVVEYLFNDPLFPATKIQDQDIESWFVLGHGQGANKIIDIDNVSGKIYLGPIINRYDKTKIASLIIHGENDGVLTYQKFRENLKYFSNNKEVHVIEKGNHTNFINTELYLNDNVALISSQKQQELTINIIKQWLDSV